MSALSPTTVTATERRRQTRGVECMEIEKVYGHGNYGVVYKAVDTSQEKRPRVALKKIKMDRESQGFPITALREIKILNQMSHKNVVKLIEIVTCHSTEEEARSRGYKEKGILPGDVFMVFEFIDYDLAGLLKSRHNLNPSVIRSYAHQLLCGVKYLHENRILHRDLKCANILVTSNNVLKIADWGLARVLPPQTHKLTVPVVTLWYRSPELILANRNYGAEIDIWSVGCIFMELYTRDPLFQGGKEAVQLDKIFNILGCPDETLLEKYKNYPDWTALNFQGFSYKSRARELYGSKLPNDNAFDLFLKLLDLDPARRISAKDALEHPFFKSEPIPDPERFARICIEPTTEHLEHERTRNAASAQQHQPHPGGAGQPQRYQFPSENEKGIGYSVHSYGGGHPRPILNNADKSKDPKLSMFTVRKRDASGAQQTQPPPPAGQTAPSVALPPSTTNNSSQIQQPSTTQQQPSHQPPAPAAVPPLQPSHSHVSSSQAPAQPQTHVQSLHHTSQQHSSQQQQPQQPAASVQPSMPNNSRHDNYGHEKASNAAVNPTNNHNSITYQQNHSRHGAGHSAGHGAGHVAEANQDQRPSSASSTSSANDGTSAPTVDIPRSRNNQNNYEYQNNRHGGGGYNNNYQSQSMSHNHNPNFSNVPRYVGGRDFGGSRGGNREFGHGYGGRDNFNSGPGYNNHNNFQQPDVNSQSYREHSSNNPRFSHYFPNAPVTNSTTASTGVVSAPPALNTSIPFELQPEPHANQRSSTEDKGDSSTNNEPNPKRTRTD